MEIHLLPVSYTHLDVYKRQVLSSFAYLKQVKVCYGSRGEADAINEDDAAKTLEMISNFGSDVKTFAAMRSSSASGVKYSLNCSR